MQDYLKHLNWIHSQQKEMVALLKTWANINSGSYNLPGLAQMLSALKSSFEVLGGTMETIPLPSTFKVDSKGNKIAVPSAAALRITKHPKAPIQVFLGGHMDTVYGVDSPFQTITEIDDKRMKGPGVTDMKGGLVVMLKALECFERSPYAGKIGWEILINPDEETGSQGSEYLFVEAAKRNQVALLFEPAFSDGSIVTARKGSANFVLVVKGRAAHAGRDFHLGRSAISAVARFINHIETLNNPEKGITINVGHIEGGGPVNIVPDLAICRFNVRAENPEDFSALCQNIQNVAAICSKSEGITFELHELASRAPKLFDTKNKTLFEAIQSCAKKMGFLIEGKPSGGVCDGNILSEEGVPTVDTLGVIGGNIHTPEEYVVLSSLSERASLAAFFLMQLTDKENYNGSKPFSSTGPS